MADNIFVGLGSNLGDRLSYITQALRDINALKHVVVEAVSPVYETEPVVCDGGWFYNVVALLQVHFEPVAFLQQLKMIEGKLGRSRSDDRGYSEERVIDLDLLFWGDKVIETHDIRVPHPRVQDRRFVLAAMCDIAPQLMHPVLHKTMRQLYHAVKNHYIVVRNNEHVVLEKG